MTYVEAVQYLESFVNYEKISSFPYKKSLKLERMRGFLALLDNPQESLHCVHIAGTKGKGSVCVFAAYILKEAGFKVGLYTSPHLVDFRERIRILESPQSTLSSSPQKDFEGMISKREIARLVERLKPIVEKYNRSCKYGALTFFEIYTALAFLYFKQKKVDYAVLESGLGGRLDATNTVNPLVCGISPISYDHTDQLGKTIKKIAKEKAGIIKSDGRLQIAGGRLAVVSAPQEKEVREVIRKRCKDADAKLYEVEKDIVWRKKRYTNGFQIFYVKGIRKNYDNLKIRLLGEYQLDNAALALGLTELLNEGKITPAAVKHGLQNALWPGRLEVLSKKPTVVLDGAQNAASALALKEALKSYFRYQKLILVLGISNDKDIKGICDCLGGIADKIILTKAKNPRAADPRVIKKTIHKPVLVTYNIKESIRQARHLATPRDLILITGSLFVAGEAREWLKIY